MHGLVLLIAVPVWIGNPEMSPARIMKSPTSTLPMNFMISRPVFSAWPKNILIIGGLCDPLPQCFRICWSVHNDLEHLNWNFAAATDPDQAGERPHSRDRAFQGKASPPYTNRLALRTTACVCAGRDSPAPCQAGCSNRLASCKVVVSCYK